MLSDHEIAAIVKGEEAQSIGYLGEGSEIQQNRATLLDYYNQREYGDEIEGQSKFVTSDVSDVIEGMLPQLLRMFTQGKHIAKFVSTSDAYYKEAEQKTAYANWAFGQQNSSVELLYGMFKDALLQYTGCLKVTWCDEEEREEENYEGLNEQELMALQMDENYEVKKVEDVTEIDEIPIPQEGMEAMQVQRYFNVEGERVNNTGHVQYDCIPPDELLVARRARDWDRPAFIAQRSPKTRSELIEMGFDRETVMSLGKDEEVDNTVKISRNYNLEEDGDSNPTGDRSKDLIYLSECYLDMDVDEDGISEYWQVMFAEGQVLEKTRVDDHPFCVCVPVPMPHRAIGSCPAEQVADIQFLKSTLVRQMLNNIYSTNYNRVIVNERVDLDDLLTPRAGGVIRVDGQGPVGDSVTPMVTANQVEQILQSIEYVDSMREVRTGITRYNQGLDTESLNKTATGFQGIRDMSQLRIELIARIFADGGVKKVFERTIELAQKHQNDAVEIKVTGETLMIDPREWKNKTECRLDVGLGAGDRMEKLGNLNFIYTQQKELKEKGSMLVDEAKMYQTLDKLCVESGLKSAESYFNDVSQPNEVLQAQNEQMQFIIQQMQQQIQQLSAGNPLAEAEQIKQQAANQREMAKIEARNAENEGKLQAKIAEIQAKAQADILKIQAEMDLEQRKLTQADEHHDDDMAIGLTKIEAETNRDVRGSLI